MIKVYVADISALKEESHFQAHYKAAGAQRQKKADTYKMQADKQRCIGAGVLLQKAVENELKSEKECVCLAPIALIYDQNGKPHLEKYPQYHISLSHSGEYAACAIATTPIGLDIQKIVSCKESVATCMFGTNELTQLALLENEEKDNYFTRIWCRKEAQGKQTGEGITSTHIIKHDTAPNACHEKQIDQYRLCLYTPLNNEIEVKYMKADIQNEIILSPFADSKDHI